MSWISTKKQNVLSFAVSLMLTIGLLFLINPWVLNWLQRYPDIWEKTIVIIWSVTFYLTLTVGFLLVSRKTIIALFKTSGTYNFLAFVTGLVVFLATNRIKTGSLEWLRIFFLMLLILQLLRFIGLFVVHGKKIDLWRNLTFSCCFLMAIFLLGEGIFMFVGRTHGYAPTLANLIWYRHHSGDLNELGYRDQPITANDTTHKSKIALVGDSFVAGSGIKRPKDRFGDVLGEKMGENYRVFNLGYGGGEPIGEFRRLEEFPWKPNLLIFSWLPNDILKRAELMGKPFREESDFSTLPGSVRFVVQHSFLINYLYWLFPHTGKGDYKTYLENCFNDCDLVAAHLKDLDHFSQYAKRHDIPLIFVIFPQMQDRKGFSFAEKIIAAFCESHQIPFLEVAPLISDLADNEITVNGNDAHPNKEVHLRLGNALHAFLFENWKQKEK